MNGYKLRKVTVYTGVGERVYTVGINGTAVITYSAGTSGVEYLITTFTGRLIQLRGNLGYEAEWEKLK